MTAMLYQRSKLIYCYYLISIKCEILKRTYMHMFNFNNSELHLILLNHCLCGFLYLHTVSIYISIKELIDKIILFYFCASY